MKLNKYILLLVASSLMTVAQASSKDDDDAPRPCPSQVIENMDSQFGHGTSLLTTCTQKRSEVKDVFAWNSAGINKRKKLAQQVHVTRNSVNNYEKLYGMKINKDFEVIAIGYSGGGRWLLTDEAYNRTYGVSTGNPTAALTQSLIERGVTVYMCQNTMRGNGWVTSDLLPGVKMVPSGAVAVLDFQHQGYKYILP